MSRSTPLLARYERSGALIAPYGEGEAAAAVPAILEDVEREYAAIRKSCAVFDLPQLGVIEASGDERIDFLNRMVTQELKGLSPFETRSSFWLSRKGRVVSDLRITELPGRALMVVDALAVGVTVESLGEYLFAEDVELEDRSEELHHLALHGPSSIALLADAAEHVDGPGLDALTPDHACALRIAGAEAVALRNDLTGEIGVELALPVDDVPAVYDALLGAGEKHRARAAGWMALNIARIEGGAPLFNIDFAADTLPAETGLLDARVSFTKGCYLGQEIVARMRSRGALARTIAAIRAETKQTGEGERRRPVQPNVGDHVYTAADPDTPVGAVTSSAISPMLGGAPACFAMMKAGAAEPGEALLVEAEGERIGATLQDGLAFWRPSGK